MDDRDELIRVLRNALAETSQYAYSMISPEGDEWCAEHERIRAAATDAVSQADDLLAGAAGDE